MDPTATRVVSWVRAALAVLAFAGLTRHAYTQQNADPTRLDLHRGPLLTTSRITGLAGAYAGVAEGIDGVFRNPASLANRPEHSSRWFDYDLAFDLLISDSGGVDLDADRVRSDPGTDLTMLNLGLSLVFDTFALGVVASTVALERPATVEVGQPRRLSFADVFLGGALALDGGAWIVGVGFNARGLGVSDAAGEHDYFGLSIDAGFLWRPPALPLRVGAQFRLGADVDTEGSRAATASGRPVEGGVAPWQVAAGASYRWAADPDRSYNAPLRSATRPDDGDTRYVLLSADIVVVGPARDAVSVESFIAGRDAASGGSVVASLHFGAEGEVFPRRLRVRVGAYFEPSRVTRDSGLGRLHATGGLELRLFRFLTWDLKASIAWDLAPGFDNVMVGVGFWN